jgi:tetratricopeptide (TPR) repeat protein
VLHDSPSCSCRRLRPPLALLLLLLAAAPARSAAASAEPAEQEDERVSAARSLYRAGRHAEAARIFEELWREGADPGAIYNAGKAREAAGAGHEAHAILNWRRYLAAVPELDPEDRTALEVKLISIERRAVPVELRYIAPQGAPLPRYVELRRPGAPPADGLVLDWTLSAPVDIYLSRGPWTLRLLGDEGLLAAQTVEIQGRGPAPQILEISGPAPVVPVTLQLGPERALSRGVELTWQGPGGQRRSEQIDEPTSTWQLPRGNWQLRARARGYLAHSAQIDANGPLTLDLQLRPDLERRLRLTLAITTGVSALALISGGAARYVVGDRDYRAALPNYRQTPQLVLDQTRRLTSGAALLSSGIGVGVVSATLSAGGGDRILLAELGIGAVLALGGGIGLPIALASPTLDPTSTPQEIQNFRGRALATTSLLGLGLGLSTASLAAVISRAVQRGRSAREPRLAASPAFSPQGASFSLSHRF